MGRRSIRIGAYWVSLLALGAAVSGPLAPLQAELKKYPSTGTSGGVTVSGTNLWTGEQTFIDNKFFVVDDGDNTKKIAFQASGITTGTTRTYTWPNSNSTIPIFAQVVTFAGPTAARTYTFFDGSVTIPSIEQPNNFTGTNTFTNTANGVILSGATFLRLGSSSSAKGMLGEFTAATPDTPVLATGSTANAFTLMEQGDSATDVGNGSCGTAACTHPQLNIQSATPGQTQYRSLAYWGTAGRAVKTLVESAATSTMRVSLAQEAGTAGTYYYSIYATDGATPQIRSGRVIFSVTNDGGTETCVLGTPEETDNTPTGTLTVTVTCDVTPTDAVDIQLNAVSSLTQTSLDAYSSLDLVGPGQVAPQ